MSAHITAIRAGGIYGHSTSTCDEAGCAGHEMFLGDITDLLTMDPETVAHYMDDEIREAVHADMAPCEWPAFLAEYFVRHEDKFGADFEVA